MSVFNFTVKKGQKRFSNGKSQFPYKGLKHPKMPQAIKLNNAYSSIDKSVGVIFYSLNRE